jgi:NAD(P)-dependent dehydrogenase (short-subunit alcohol dehydrogenase family)
MIITARRHGEQLCWSELWTRFSARTVFWLASDLASFVNGVVLPVDGGWETFSLPNLTATAQARDAG